MPRATDPSSERRFDASDIAQAAAEWVVRRDRGLTPREQDELSSWLARNPRHASEFARIGGAWKGMDDLSGFAELGAMADDIVQRQAGLERPRHVWRRRFLAPALGMAAALVFVFAAWSFLSHAPSKHDETQHRVLASTLHRVVLPDGSTADLNGDSRIETNFTATERRVRLVSGEAHFTVAKNPERPFFVTAGSITVRAVGTAFNVRLQSERIEVLVTEGKVKLEGTPPKTSADTGLSAGQRAVIASPAEATASLDVCTLAQAEIDEVLSWQNTRLAFNNTSLDEVVTAFNSHNKRRLRLGDPALAKRRITGVFRSDNLDGFTRLAGAIVDVRAETVSPEEIVLWPAP